MLGFLSRVLGRDKKETCVLAKERLRLVLVHDRAAMSPLIMNSLKDDFIKVISNYMIIDEEEMEVFLDQKGREVSLIANIPIKKIRRDFAEARQA
ncbi:MAG: cell division topological specificity factor MinE [Eubacteriales bacterium]